MKVEVESMTSSGSESESGKHEVKWDVEVKVENMRSGGKWKLKWKT